MVDWKNHVRCRLQVRDLTEKHPFTGVFTRCKHYIGMIMQVWLIHFRLIIFFFFFFSPPSVWGTRAFWNPQSNFRAGSFEKVRNTLLFGSSGVHVSVVCFTVLYVPSLEKGGVEDGRHTRLLQLQLRESEHLEEKVECGEKTHKLDTFVKLMYSLQIKTM